MSLGDKDNNIKLGMSPTGSLSSPKSKEVFPHSHLETCQVFLHKPSQLFGRLFRVLPLRFLCLLLGNRIPPRYILDPGPTWSSEQVRRTRSHVLVHGGFWQGSAARYHVYCPFSPDVITFIPLGDAQPMESGHLILNMLNLQTGYSWKCVS